MPSNWAAWAQPLPEKMEDMALKYQATELPSLHGRTDNNQYCKCMPGSLEPPDPSTAMRRALEAKESGLTREHYFKAERDRINAIFDPKVKTVKTEATATDEQLEALRKTAAEVDAAAGRLHAAFHALKEAHAQGGCDTIANRIANEMKQVHHLPPGVEDPMSKMRAELEEQEPLHCDKDINVASGLLQERINDGAPACQLGVTSPSALTSVSAMPAELALLLPSPAVGQDLGCRGHRRAACGRGARRARLARAQRGAGFL